jgi:hypothetical protein
MNPIFSTWLVQGQPRRKIKTGNKVQEDYVTKSTTATAISQSQAQDGADGI